MFVFMYSRCLRMGILICWLIYWLRCSPGLTCVWVNPRLAASSALSGSAKYCVRWNRRLSCCNCSELYIVRGFRIFLPLPFTRRPVSSILSASRHKEREKRHKFVVKHCHQKVCSNRWYLASPRHYERLCFYRSYTLKFQLSKLYALCASSVGVCEQWV